MPSAYMSSATNARLFTMLAEASISAHTLQLRHENYPFKLFLLIESGDIADEICNEPECRLDPWSKALLDHHREVLRLDARSPVVIVDLVNTALDAEVDSVSIECGHTVVRRLLGKLSYQTKIARLDHVSARWVNSKIKTHEYQFAKKWKRLATMKERTPSVFRSKRKLT